MAFPGGVVACAPLDDDELVASIARRTSAREGLDINQHPRKPIPHATTHVATQRQTRLTPADPQAIAEAAACLNAGGLVAMPTETVYGLAAYATYDRASPRSMRPKDGRCSIR